MSKKIYKICNINEAVLPKNLLDTVINRVNQEKRLIAIKRRLLLYFLAFSSSTILFVFNFFWFKNQFNESGFFEYISLFYLDFNIVMTYWQDFALTLLEITPSLAIATILFFAIVSYLFAKKLKESIKELNKFTHQLDNYEI